MKDRIDRRELLNKAFKLGIAYAGIEAVSTLGLAKMVSKAEASQKSLIALASGTNIASMVEKAINGIGGISRFFSKGAKVAIKPNNAWAMRPEQASNTHPGIMDALLTLCKQAGASQITVFDNTCDSYPLAFKESGIQAVCEKHGVRMIAGVNRNQYVEMSVPFGKALKTVLVNRLITESDCYINVPIVKVHSGGKVTIALKNQIGCTFDMSNHHRLGLHQCIADLATVVRPAFCLIDATRMLLTRGPRGPGEVKNENKIFASTDLVAADAYGSTLLGIKPDDVDHIRFAHSHGIGQMNLNSIEIKSV